MHSSFGEVCLAHAGHLCQTPVVPRKKSIPSGSEQPAEPNKQISLKDLAEYLGLAPATVSLVMNRSPVVDSVPQDTKDRIFDAARKLNYRPNFLARSLRTQRSFVIGVIVPEVSEGYAAMVLSGIEDHLLHEGYFYFVASHRHQSDLIDEYCQLFLRRSVDGFIAVDTPWHQKLSVPAVTVSGHNALDGVTNIVLDHDHAAELALEHLMQHGHRRIAFIKGQEFSSDTEVRWHAILNTARRLGLKVDAKLTIQLQGDIATPELGYKVTAKLLEKRARFTALFAFNDISAMGAIRAIRAANSFGGPDRGMISSIHFEPMRPSGNGINSRITRLPPQPRIGIHPAIKNRPPGTSAIEGTARPS